MATVLISGGTGMIGKRLSIMLTEKNYDVIILQRSKNKEQKKTGKQNLQSKISFASWDIEKGLIDKNAIEKADYIIHLAGENVAKKRWTKKRKEEIIESRTRSSALIVSALKKYSNNIKAVVSASAIGWYGADTADSLNTGFIESEFSANDFLGETCRLWEESITPVESLGKRLVILRTGIVLAEKGGALEEFIKPLKGRLAAILGSGEQIMSWIHIDDICKLYIYAIENNALHGAYNAVAPKPISNKELTLELAKEMNGKKFISIHVPAFILKIMLGEMSVEVLKSATVNCNKIKREGFTFLYPSVESALHEIISSKKK